MARWHSLPAAAAVVCFALGCGSPSDEVALGSSQQALSSAEADALTAKMALGAKFAPLVFLHPQDRYRPTNATTYFNSAAQSADGTLVVPQTWANTHGEPVDGGESHAPSYFRVTSWGGRTYVQYYFFFGTNGCQGFRIGTGTIFNKGTRSFEWCDFAYHEADWEHITLRLTADENGVERGFYAAHGDEGVWFGPQEMRFDGTHPLVFSAMNSHASYPTDQAPYDFKISETLPINLPASVRWIHAGDVVSKDLGADTYERQPFNDYVRWNTRQNLEIIDDLQQPAWANYAGPWGQTHVNSGRDAPGSLPGDVKFVLKVGSAIAGAVGALDSYKSGGAPRSPRHQGPWNDLDQPPPEQQACFLFDAGYAGKRECFGVGEFGSVGSNDRYSSVRLYGGVTARLYKDAGFAGDSRTLTGDNDNLGNAGFNDATSSLRITAPGAPLAEACFFVDDEYRGARACFPLGDTAYVGKGWNDKFTSVRLYGGAIVDMWDNANFGGGVRTVTGDTGNVGTAFGFNDKVSSLRVRL